MTSIFTVVAVSGIFFILAEATPLDYAETRTPAFSWFWGVGILVLGNLVPDYLSNVETRFLLGKLERSRGWSVLVTFLVADLLFTAAVFLMLFPAYLHLILVQTHGRDIADVSSAYIGAFRNFWAYITNPGIDIIDTTRFDDQIQFFSTFFTSIWLWLFSSACILQSILAQPAGRLWVWLRSGFLDIENSPILVLGWVASGLVLVGFLLAAPLTM